MTNQYEYLRRAHRVCCEIASEHGGLKRTQLREAAEDIEAFCKHAKQTDVANRMHATREVLLPETMPGVLESRIP